MRVEFGGDRVDGGLEEADQRALVLDRRPAEAPLGAFEQGPDAALARVGYGRPAGRIEGKFLVLDADAERLRRLAARRQPLHQIVA